jgi:hypothetical protein
MDSTPIINIRQRPQALADFLLSDSQQLGNVVADCMTNTE